MSVVKYIPAQNSRPFKIDVFGLLDDYIATLLSYEDAFLGRMVSPQLSLSSDGTHELSFKIPKWYYDPKQGRIENPRWRDTENGIIAENTRVLKVSGIQFKNGKTKVLPFIIESIKDGRDKHFETYKEVKATGYGFADLGKQGYKLELNYDLVDRERKDDPDITPTINYWLDKVFPNTKDESGKVTSWDTPWCYEIRMDYEIESAAFGESYKRTDIDFSYTNDVITAENVELGESADGELDFTNAVLNYYARKALSIADKNDVRSSNKVYDDPYVSNWKIETEGGVEVFKPVKVIGAQEKARIIDCLNSNKYNITQTIAETFGVYCTYEYETLQNGKFIDSWVDDDGNLWTGKKVVFYNESIKYDNPLHINYENNLNTITREADSKDLYTKMFVVPIDADEMTNKKVTIADTNSNKMLEDYIFNFDYLYSIGGITDFQKQEIDKYQIFMRKINLELARKLEQYSEQMIITNDYNAKATQALNEALAAETNYNEYVTKRDNPGYGVPVNREKFSNIWVDELGYSICTLNNTTSLTDFEGIDVTTVKCYQNEGTIDSPQYVLKFGYGENNFALSSGNVTKDVVENPNTYFYILDDTGCFTSVYVNTTLKNTDFPSGESHDIRPYFDFIFCPTNKYAVLTNLYENKMNNAREQYEAYKKMADESQEKQDQLEDEIKDLEKQKENKINYLSILLGPALREGYWQCDEYDTAALHYDVIVGSTIPATSDGQFLWDGYIEDEKNWFENEQRPYYIITEGATPTKHPYYILDLSDIADKINLPTLLAFRVFPKKTTNVMSLVINTDLLPKNYLIRYADHLYYFTLQSICAHDSTLLLDATILPPTLTIIPPTDSEESILHIKLSTYALENAINLDYFSNAKLYIFMSGNGGAFFYGFKKEEIEEDEEIDENDDRDILPIAVFNNIPVGTFKEEATDEGLYANEYDIVYYNMNLPGIETSIDEQLTNQWDYTNYVIPRIVIKTNNILSNSDTLSILKLGIEVEDKNAMARYEDYIVLSRSEETTITPKVTDRNLLSDILKGTYDLRYDVSHANETLYADAIKVAEENSHPKYTYSVKIANMPDDLNKEVELGLLVFINDYSLDLKANGYIKQIVYNLDNPKDDEITISDYKTKFEDLFGSITATNEAMKSNTPIYNNIASSYLNGGTSLSPIFLLNALKNAEYYLSYSGSNISIEPETGIILENASPYANGVKGQVVLKGGGIFLSNQLNGDNRVYTTAITPDGINASTIKTGRLDTNLINIYAGDNVAFLWNPDGIFAYKSDESGYHTDTYVRYNQDGLLFNDGGFEAVKLGWDGLSIKAQNGAVSLTATNGLEVFDGNNLLILLGKRSADEYGLFIKDCDNNDTLVAKGDGTLWLKQKLSVGEGLNAIEIEHNNGSSSIGTAAFASGPVGTGWRVDGEGSATFNNINARGKLSAVVFEYEKVNSVGGSLYIAPTLLTNDDEINVEKTSV